MTMALVSGANRAGFENVEVEKGEGVSQSKNKKEEKRKGKKTKQKLVIGSRAVARQPRNNRQQGRRPD